MAGSSEEDRRKQVARFKKQSKHWLTREQELQQQQQAKARKAGRIKQRHDDWSADDDDPAVFEKIARPGRERPRPALSPAAIEGLPRGTVTAVHAGRVEIDFAPARLASAMVNDPEQRLAVGDEVAFEVTDGPPRIVARLPRRSVLARPDPGNEHRELVLAANVDLVVIVVAAADPPLRPGLIDRFLLALQRGGAAPLLCVNKVDLLDDAGRARLALMLQPYEELAVPVIRCSASAGLGIDELQARLRGRTCVFAGHSGVGKSSLLNAIDPAGGRATGAVRDFDGKGRHTTTAAMMRQLSDGTRVIDTPGIRALGLQELTRDELQAAFADLQAFAGGCRFADCSHAHEPDCAVRAAVAAGRLSAARHGSWLRLQAGDDG
ncbi:MAG: ribosome small subunit-dependent GTPase A [Planctomycetes bacterium]|nr:ribosome small subunit-dependent GTPase A [Planctomycetota bacterium]